jgi:hypothetical protein
MMPIGNFAVGALTDWIGAPLTVGLAGATLTLAALLLGRPLRRAGAAGAAG